MSTEPPPRPAGTYSTDYHREETYTRTTGAGATHTSSAHDDEKSGVGFTAIALAHAVLSFPLAVGPRNTAKFLLGETTPPFNQTHEQLMGMLAAGLLSGGAAAWALKESSDGGTLDSDSSERLQLGLMGMAAAAVAAHFKHSRDLTNNGLSLGAATAALTFAVPAAHMLATKKGRRRLGDRIKGFFGAIGRLFDFRNGFKVSSGLYAVLTPIFFVAGAAYSLNPQATLGNLMGYVMKKPDSVFLWRNIGGTLLTLLPAMTFSLKEKADQGRLQDKTPRILNTGLFLTSLGHLLILGPIGNRGDGGKYFPAMVGTWAAALLASMVGLATGNEGPKRL